MTNPKTTALSISMAPIIREEYEKQRKNAV